MKKFVIFLLTALLALSGCKGGDGAELELIKEDILAERFGENLVGVTNEFSILKCKILNCEEDEDEKVLTVRAIAEDENESVRVTGTYAVTYTDQRGEIVEDSFPRLMKKSRRKNRLTFQRTSFCWHLSSWERGAPGNFGHKAHSAAFIGNGQIFGFVRQEKILKSNLHTH